MVDFDTILQSGAMGLAFFALYILYQFINGKRNGNGNGNGKQFTDLGKKMDTLGDKMDKLGDRFDHSMERFCDKVEGKLDRLLEKEMEK